MRVPDFQIPILMYHRIGDKPARSLVRDQYVPVRLFEKHLAELQRRGYKTVSLTEMANLLDSDTHEGKHVVITFDDGYLSFSQVAVPLLRKFGMKATVFLVENCIGRTNRWDEAKGDITVPLMDDDEIRRVEKEGMEIGAHTVSHPDLRFCDDVATRSEIAGCKRLLQERLNLPIHWLSYPYGMSGPRERQLAREAGFKGACGTRRHPNRRETDLFDLGRINVRSSTSAGYLLYKLRKVSRGHG